jgi:chromosome partitioning protein
MKVIAFATQKGGVGKSTLCLSCAVLAAAEGSRVAVIDADPQGTLVRWAGERGGRPPPVTAVAPTELSAAVERQRRAGCDTVFIDTRSGDDAGTAVALRAADYIVVPTRISPADVWAVAATVEALRRLGKPFAVALNQTPPVGFRLVAARETTTELGKAVPRPLALRTDHQDAVGRGLGVTEFNPDGKAAAEIREMWNWLKVEIEGIGGAEGI